MSKRSLPTTFEMFILFVLRDQKLQDDSGGYGVSIHRRICDITNKNITYASIYKSLRKLTSEKLIDSYKGDPTHERGGRAITYYKINESGQDMLKKCETWNKQFNQTYREITLSFLKKSVSPQIYEMIQNL